METLSIIFGILTGLEILVFTYKPIFGSHDEFRKWVKYLLIPDIISFFRGKEYHKDIRS